MKLAQIPELVATAQKIETRLLTDLETLMKARGVAFAVSAYTTALSQVIGAAIALSKNPELRDTTIQAVNMIIEAATQEANAIYETSDAIEKASKS